MIPQSFVDQCEYGWVDKVKVNGGHGAAISLRKMGPADIYTNQIPELKVRSLKAAKDLCRDGGNGFFVHGSLVCYDKVLSIDVRVPGKIFVSIICRFKPKYKTALHVPHVFFNSSLPTACDLQNQIKLMASALDSVTG